MAIVEMVHTDTVLRMGTCRNLLVCAWLATPEPTHFRTLSRGLHTLIGKHGSDIGVFDVIIAGRPVFSDELRDGLVRVLKDPRTQGHGMAHVIEVGGLAAVTTRAFLSTAFLLAHSTSPNKVFGDVASGAAWMASTLSKGAQVWSAAEIVDVQATISQRKATTATG
jgi:hypothetical protein